MKKRTCLLIFSVLLSFIFACGNIPGGDSGDNTGNDPGGNTNNNNDYYAGAKVVSSESELPECNSSTDGQLFYVLSGKAFPGEFKYCDGDSGNYVAIDLMGSDGSDGSDGDSCTVKDNSDDTYTISCEDGTTAIVSDGANGSNGMHGTSCTVTDNGNGTKTISCGESNTVTVYDGESCTVEDVDATGDIKKLVCGDDTTAIINTPVSCIVDTTDDGATISCVGGSEVTVYHGKSIIWKDEGAAPPASPEVNWAYYNTVEKAAYIYAGPVSGWQLLVRDGISIVWKGESPVHLDTPGEYWAYYNTNDKITYIYNGTWQVLTKDGADGEDGADGISIIWKGSHSNPPAGEQLNWAYYDIDDGIVYIFDGTGWKEMIKDGNTGPVGADGADGISIIWKGTHSSHPTGEQLNWAYYNKTDGIAYIYDGTDWTVLIEGGGGLTSDVPGDTLLSDLDIPDMLLKHSIISTGVHFVSELEVLILYGDVKDLTGIDELTSLKCLDASQSLTEISNLSILGNLTNLETLLLAYNDITDIGFISSLSNLIELDLSYNNIIDFSALNSIKSSLRELDLSGNTADFNFLSTYSAIDVLILSDAGLSDIGFISSLTTSLIELDLSYNEEITDISPIIPPPGPPSTLEKLNLEGNYMILCSDLDNLETELGSDVIIRPEECSLTSISWISGTITFPSESEATALLYIAAWPASLGNDPANMASAEYTLPIPHGEELGYSYSLPVDTIDPENPEVMLSYFIGAIVYQNGTFGPPLSGDFIGYYNDTTYPDQSVQVLPEATTDSIDFSLAAKP